MEFRVLGLLEVVHDGRPLDLGPRKQRSLLALLLIHANRVVSTDRIVDELWRDDAEGKENALWVYVSRLRSGLEPERVERGESSVLLTRDHGYMLSIDSDSIDSHRFEVAAAEGRSLIRDDATAASEILREALQLWRGSALEDFAYDDFAQAEITRLEELRLSALGDRIEADLRRGQAGELIGELEAFHQQHPLRERPVGQLMLALYRAGRQADALRAFERFRRGIGEELGTEPSPELRRLEEQVLLHDSRIQARRTAVGRTAAVNVASAVNPFKGLRAFHEDDDTDFFGRDRLVADVVRRLDRGERLIGLVGPSGSGKSSVVRAGLIPALRKGAITGSDAWLIAQMVPGSHPFAELEAALLRSSLDAPDSLTDQLADPETGILRAALRMIPSDESRLLLVIDQLEELFTLVEDDGERGRFLDGLMSALDDPHGRIMVVLTLRADFYDRPLAYPEFGTRLGDGVVNVVPLTSDELEKAAQKPAQRAGVTFEPALLAALLTDVVGQPGALPLFQYTMTELFDRRVGDTLTLDSYRAMDGVSGALTQRADDLFAELDPDQQAAAQQLFLRLVTIADSDEWGRRRVPASEIVSLDVDVVALQSIIELYARHRLLTLDRDFVTGSPTVEVAHEALLTEWGRLRGWIEDGREDVRRHATLTTAMNEWIEADRDDDYLLGGARLEGYEQWAASAVMQLTAVERGYLDAAIEVREQTNRAESERVALEAKTARSARRRLWGLAAAVAVLAAVGVWLFVAELAPEPPVIALLGIERDGAGGIRDQIADGFEQAQRDFGFQPDTITPISDPRAEIEKFLDTGPGLVILENAFAVGGDSELAVEELAEKYPGVWFAVLEGAFFSEVDMPNMTFAAFRSEEGSFLAGAAAAITSQTRIIGFVGGPPIVIDAFRAGFEAGAKFVDPDVEILSRYLSGPGFEVFGDRALSEEAAHDLFRRGADVIYHAAGEGGRGIFTAAAEGSNETTRLWGIGVDVNEYLVVDPEVRDYVLTSVLKRHDSAVEVFIERYLDGTLESGPLELGLGNDSVGYARSGGFLDEATISELEDIRRAIVAGAIAVPHLPDGPATSPPPADVEATLTFDGQRCDLVGIGAPELGEFVRVSIENASPVEVVLAIFKFRDGTTIDDLQGSGPFAFSSFPGFFYTAARVNPGRTHALTVELALRGVWGVTCLAESSDFYTPLFTVGDR